MNIIELTRADAIAIDGDVTRGDPGDQKDGDDRWVRAKSRAHHWRAVGDDRMVRRSLQAMVAAVCIYRGVWDQYPPGAGGVR